ncbi:uncharacterized protein LOC111021400 isoform X2 [Momordica charantia]|uniref:Uncharacterized protein LOC111021400 isoform X2 n=1 Tax=Momordica charantia TaxID=3673 RepID=A0A6J1DKL6_MOMCH|nr:uncharacterized protein LOC111021400 isoform X2 [Momordica charantia]
MASACHRIASRISQSSFRAAVRTQSPVKSPSSPFPLPSKSTAPSVRRFSLARSPSELGCVQSLLPFHNAVAGARMISCLSTNSRSCRALSQELGLSVPR